MPVNNLKYIILLSIWVIVTLSSVCAETEPKSSLGFVIDKTISMGDVIKDVFESAYNISKAVMSSSDSPVANYVLVFFGDPNVSDALVTENHEEFAKVLNDTLGKLENGTDCPELSMTGIETALKASLNGSFLYVFTDASAKDAKKFDEVKYLAQEKNIQVNFILINRSGACGKLNDPKREYDVYTKLAFATSGLEFNLRQPDVPEILKYVEDSITSRKITLHSKMYSPGAHNINIDVDSRSSGIGVIVTEPFNTDEPMGSPTIIGPDGDEIDEDPLVSLGQIKVIKIEESTPGKYGIFFGNDNTSSYVVVTARSDVTFRHGFSKDLSTSLDDTIFNPISATKNYLSIKLFGENVTLTTVQLLDENYADISISNLTEIPLKLQDKKQNFYITERFDPPHIPFRIVVKGIDTVTGTIITRFGNMVLETETKTYKNPTVTIEGDSKITVDYDAKLKLVCAVEAYPEPTIIWRELKDRKEIPSSLTIHPPYNYNRILELDNITKNTTYECHAANKLGIGNKSVQVEVKPQKYFELEETPEDQEIDFNEPAVLKCKVNSYPPAKITWLPEKRIKILKSYGEIEISSDKSTMTIKHMRRWAVQKFACKVQYLDKPYYTFYASLKLSARKPVLYKEPLVYDVSVIEGGNTNLTCRLLEGKPQPKILWLRQLAFDSSAQFKELEEGINLTTINLNNCNIYDTGLYKCKAQNVMGSDERLFNLSVESKPKIRNDTGDITTIIAEAYTEVNMKCTVVGIPIPEVEWFKDGEPLEIDEDNGITVFRNNHLRLKDVNEDHTGIYTCKAVNKLGSAEKTVNLTVYYLEIDPPRSNNITTTHNEGLSLRCVADGFPEPIRYTWIFRNNTGSPIIISENKERGWLKYDEVEDYQRGTYTCVANNTYASKNITYTLFDVLYGPKIRNPPQTYYTAVEGDQSLKLPCGAIGNPTPTIEWWINGYPVKGDRFKIASSLTGTGCVFDGAWLMINNITSRDHGDYICEARNEIGTSHGQIMHVTVLEYPKRESIKHNTVLWVENGNKVQIKCPLPHEELDWLVWYKQGKVFHFGELEFNKVSRSNEGVYTCRVTKQMLPGGIETANVTVKVGSKPTFVEEQKRNVELKFKEPGYLNCLSLGDPTPTVSWWHNRKKMSFKRMVHSFIMDTESVGKFTCQVTNPLGSIRRIFEVNFKDCVLKIDSYTEYQPITLTTSGTWPSFNTIDGFTIIPKYEMVEFHCPKYFTAFEKSALAATCIGGTSFDIQRTLLDYADIKCNEEVNPILTDKNKKEKCLGEDTEFEKLVFEIRNKTIEALGYCLDKYQFPIYSKHLMRSVADYAPKNTTMWDGTKFDSYNCDQQVKRFQSSPLDVASCCFAAMHLVNPKDLLPGPLQRASYNRLNIVPHWSTCHSEHWAEVEERVRKLVKSFNNDLIIYTGTAGPWYQRLNNKDILMSIKRREPISTYLWKVIQYPAAKSSIAIVQLNIPGVSTSEIERNHILCEDICHELTWMKDRNWRQVNKGYTYCCKLADFITAFRRKNFGRDFLAWKVFEPYYNVL